VALLGIGGSGPQSQARTRQYSAAQACLLTGSDGVSGKPAATVWAGMEDASRATSAMVTFLPVAGPATAAHAVPYANSLIEQHCNVIVGVGTAETSALSQSAARAKGITFVLVGSTTVVSTAANLRAVGLSADTRSQVAEELGSLLNG
jgi:hypothetical protein